MFNSRVYQVVAYNNNSENGNKIVCRSDFFNTIEKARELAKHFPVFDSVNYELTIVSFCKEYEEEDVYEETIEPKSSDTSLESEEGKCRCFWCKNLFDEAQVHKHTDLGVVCDRCYAAIKSRGEQI